MEALLNEINKLSKISINKILEEILSDSSLQHEIIDRVRYGQLFKEGVSEENVVIGYYSPYTQSINPDKKVNTHYTLLDTGDFYESFKIHVNADSFIIDANGNKADGTDIVYKFSEKAKSNILGLADENILWLQEILKPMINERIEAIL